MTIDEAIQNREECLKYLEGLGKKASQQNVEAVHWSVRALKALRPVSRERVFPGCEYCTNNIKSRKEYITKEYPGLCDFEVFLDGFRTQSDIAVITYNHQTPFTEDICFSFHVLYCPHCGRPLTDEAVDIRLKELEALNDAGNQ